MPVVKEPVLTWLGQSLGWVHPWPKDLLIKGVVAPTGGHFDLSTCIPTWLELASQEDALNNFYSMQGLFALELCPAVSQSIKFEIHKKKLERAFLNHWEHWASEPGVCGFGQRHQILTHGRCSFDK